MPCHSEPSQEDVEREKRFDDAKTRLACMKCREMELEGEPIPDWALEWWTAHRNWDTARQNEESQIANENLLRVKALKKLSPQERRALGV